jgi:hypothetical protein
MKTRNVMLSREPRLVADIDNAAPFTIRFARQMEMPGKLAPAKAFGIEPYVHLAGVH